MKSVHYLEIYVHLLSQTKNGMDVLRKILSDHINLKQNMLTERYNFKERKHEPQESISQFVAALKKVVAILSICYKL